MYIEIKRKIYPLIRVPGAKKRLFPNLVLDHLGCKKVFLARGDVYWPMEIIKMP